MLRWLMLVRVVEALLCTALAIAVTPVACGGETVTDSPKSGAGAEGGTGGGARVDAGVPENTGFCQPYCATRADCCTDCTYPNNLDCRDRHCVSLGCTGDADCVRQSGSGHVCRRVRGLPRCIEPCASDTDCDSRQCASRDDLGLPYCARLPGLQIPCFDDSGCKGRGVCDVTTHSCGCSVDSQCPAGSVCVPQ
jgi:hypothetical protein